MVKLPRVPELRRLRQLDSEILEIPQGQALWRVYYRSGNHPTRWNGFRHFGPLDARFDHHALDLTGAPFEQGRGILYVGAAGKTCLGEVFQKNRLIDRTSNDPWLVSFHPARRLRLLDLTGDFATRCGASAAIATGPRGAARSWAQAFYETYPDIDGLAYSSSMAGNALAAALFERATDGVPAHPTTNRALNDPVLTTLLKNAAQDLGYGLR